MSEAPCTVKRNKGRSLLSFPSSYTVIDLETTGYSPELDDIIEMSAVKIEDGTITDTFSSLVRPLSVCFGGKKIFYVNEFITKLTGITNEMLATAPALSEVLPKFQSFVGDSILVGHNIHFDINFIYDSLIENGIVFRNDFCDLLRISRFLLPDLPHHRLSDIASFFNYQPEEEHRGLADCMTTFFCFEKCRDLAIEKDLLSGDTSSLKRNSTRRKVDLRTLQADESQIDDTHFLYGKECVFTGTLERMLRTEAAQMVLNIGGQCANSVTKKTNCLILGNNDYVKSIKDGKSNKQKKAEALITSGQDLIIIPEDVFYDLFDIK